MSALVKAKAKLGTDKKCLAHAIRLYNKKIAVEDAETAGGLTLEGYYTLRGKKADVVVRAKQLGTHSDFGISIEADGVYAMFEDVDAHRITSALTGNNAYGSDVNGLLGNLYSAAAADLAAQSSGYGPMEFAMDSAGNITAAAKQHVMM